MRWTKEKIKAFRKEYKLTQVGLASLLRTNTTRIAYIETGRSPVTQTFSVVMDRAQKALIAKAQRSNPLEDKRVFSKFKKKEVAMADGRKIHVLALTEHVFLMMTKEDRPQGEPLLIPYSLVEVLYDSLQHIIKDRRREEE